MTAKSVATTSKPFQDEDVGNIILMEHVNLQVPDQSIATLFYLVGMGFTRDPHMMVGLENMWVNLGEQQFHLPTAPAQVLRGHTGVVVPNLDTLVQRLETVQAALAGTHFDWSRAEGHVDVVSPWGNLLRCYEPSDHLGHVPSGIPYIEFETGRGSAAGIAHFYNEVFLSPARLEEDQAGLRTIVEIGAYQSLVFREADQTADYDGHHFAIYVADFSTPHAFLAERGLLTEAPSNHQLRFQEIVDPGSGAPLFTIEHEVRSLRHAQFRRPLVNRTLGEFAEPRRVGGRTVFEAKP